MTKRKRAKRTDKGNHARSPRQIPLAGWKQIVARTWNQSWVDNVGLVAAGVAFYGFLALVPLLGMIVLIYGVFAEPQTVIGNMELLIRILPPNVAQLIGEMLLSAVGSSGETKGVGILVALLFALYGGSNGAGALITSLNIAYQEKEKRSLARVYGIAILITVIAISMAVLALIATAALSKLDQLVPDASGAFVSIGRGVAYVFLLLAAAAIVATLYRFGPSREHATWTWITPGSMFTAAVWLLLTLAFGFYVTKIADYSATYGSLGAIVALQTWLYLSAYVFVFGAELNSEIEHQTSFDSTTGKPEPLGKRGAWAADNVAGGKAATVAETGPSLSEAAPGAVEQKEEEREARKAARPKARKVARKRKSAKGRKPAKR